MSDTNNNHSGNSGVSVKDYLELRMDNLQDTQEIKLNTLTNQMEDLKAKLLSIERITKTNGKNITQSGEKTHIWQHILQPKILVCITIIVAILAIAGMGISISRSGIAIEKQSNALQTQQEQQQGDVRRDTNLQAQIDSLTHNVGTTNTAIAGLLQALCNNDPTADYCVLDNQ